MKYKFVVSGAANMSFCCSDAEQKFYQIGQEIVRQDGILITGATTGIPHMAAKGAKEEGGIVVGFSPAKTEKEHIEHYQLPTDYHDLIIYTGFEYSGRNLLLTRSADAVVVGCGRMGTINEFTIAFEDKKPIGILEGEWETDELLKTLIEKSHRAEEMKDKIVYSSDPKELLDKLVEIIKREKEKNNH